MKQLVLVGTLAVALGGVTFAQAQTKTGGHAKAASQADGHTTPKQQPNSAPAPAAPGGEMALGTVHFDKGVKANGNVLPAGTYQVRLTTQSPSQEAKGESQGLERWVEFLQRGQVKGREVATIVPTSEISNVEKDAPPPANSSKVQTLKGGDYVRLWINKGGNHYLIHFPAA